MWSFEPSFAAGRSAQTANLYERIVLSIEARRADVCQVVLSGILHVHSPRKEWLAAEQHGTVGYRRGVSIYVKGCCEKQGELHEWGGERRMPTRHRLTLPNLLHGRALPLHSSGSVQYVHCTQTRNWRLEDAVIGTSRTHGHTHQARVYVAGYSTRV